MIICQLIHEKIISKTNGIVFGLSIVSQTKSQLVYILRSFPKIKGKSSTSHKYFHMFSWAKGRNFFLQNHFFLMRHVSLFQNHKIISFLFYATRVSKPKLFHMTCTSHLQNHKILFIVSCVSKPRLFHLTYLSHFQDQQNLFSSHHVCQNKYVCSNTNMLIIFR